VLAKGTLQTLYRLIPKIWDEARRWRFFDWNHFATVSAIDNDIPFPVREGLNHN